jgi:hypothetical protein
VENGSETPNNGTTDPAVKRESPATENTGNGALPITPIKDTIYKSEAVPVAVNGVNKFKIKIKTVHGKNKLDHWALVGFAYIDVPHFRRMDSISGTVQEFHSSR